MARRAIRLAGCVFRQAMPVDELMALCDQLNQAKHLQGKIADVLVEQALV